MAIIRSFANVNIFPPSVNGMNHGIIVLENYPGYTCHDTFANMAHNNEDPGVCLAFLRALRNCKIISGVRCNDMVYFHINASVPNE